MSRFGSKLLAVGDLHWCQSWRAGLLLLSLCLVVYLPGLSALAPVDRDECRFAQASRQMFESVVLDPSSPDFDPALHGGKLAIPKYGSQLRLNKPPLVYWLQSASAALFTAGDPSRDAMWMYRLPSALCATLSVLALWRLGQGMFDPRVATLAAAILAVSPMIVWDAHQARSDQLLLFATLLAQLALWRVWTAVPEHPHFQTWRSRWAMPLLFWFALAAGILAKGPITPMVAALTALFLIAVERRTGWLARLRPLVGVPLVLLLVGTWAFLVVQQIGWSAAVEILNEEVFRRATVGSREGHFAPPGTHFVLLAALLWPGSLLTLWGLGQAIRIGVPRVGRPAQTPAASSVGPGRWASIRDAVIDRARGKRGEFFCLAWLLPSWIIFELSTSKLPHYTMPLYPAAALLSARAVFWAASQIRRGNRSMLGFPGLLLWATIGVIPVIACFAILLLAAARGPVALGVGLSLPVLLAFGLAMAVAGAVFVRAFAAVRCGRVIEGQWLSLLAGAVALACVMQWGAPRFAPGEATSRLMQAVKAVELAERRPIASLYHEDSLVFATRGRVNRITPGDVQAWMAEHPSGILIVPEVMNSELFASGWLASEPVELNFASLFSTDPSRHRRFIVAAQPVRLPPKTGKSSP